jgi:uncharacterized protein YecE (DUF72 family)
MMEAETMDAMRSMLNKRKNGMKYAGIPSFCTANDLVIEAEDLIENITGIKELGAKLGVLLLQFPAGQNFHTERMEIFYSTIRSVYDGPLVIEPRNMTWMFRDSLKLMKKYRLSKVTADPEKCFGDVEGDIAYYRLHGSPEIYSSDYSPEYLDNLRAELETYQTDVWCIFDNTTFGYATLNALNIHQRGDVYERNQRIHDGGYTDVHAIHKH